MDNILKYFEVNMNSNLDLLNYNYNRIIHEIRESNLDTRNKNFIIFFIKEKYNYIYNKIKSHQNNDILLWENFESC